MRHLNQQEVEALERMIDVASMGDVLVALEVICGDKAVHLRANYGDLRGARNWDRLGKRIRAWLDRQDPRDLVFTGEA